MSLWSNGADWVLSLQKSLCDFMARTFALIAPLQPISHRVYYRNETFRNAPKHYETLQNMSLGVLWGGSGAVVLRNYDATSWHEPLH